MNPAGDHMHRATSDIFVNRGVTKGVAVAVAWVSLGAYVLLPMVLLARTESAHLKESVSRGRVEACFRGDRGLDVALVMWLVCVPVGFKAALDVARQRPVGTVIWVGIAVALGRISAEWMMPKYLGYGYTVGMSTPAVTLGDWALIRGGDSHVAGNMLKSMVPIAVAYLILTARVRWKARWPFRLFWLLAVLTIQHMIAFGFFLPHIPPRQMSFCPGGNRLPQSQDAPDRLRTIRGFAQAETTFLALVEAQPPSSSFLQTGGPATSHR